MTITGEGTQDFMVQVNKLGDTESGMQLMTRLDVPNAYYLDMSMTNQMDAGQTMKYLEEFMPKGSTISSKTSLSMDSYKLMLNRVKRGKFSIVPNQTGSSGVDVLSMTDLNMMAKTTKKGISKNGLVSKVDAEQMVKEINNMLSNAGVESQAKSIRMSPEGTNVWKVKIPNLTLKMEYQKGGFKSKYQTGGINREKPMPMIESTQFQFTKAFIENNRRKELKDAIDLVSSKESKGTQEDMRELLTQTNYMENSMGHNSEAYNRSYTNSQASIDPIMFTDLFSPRVDEDGKSQGFTNTQKKHFQKLEDLGLPSDSINFKKELQSDNPLAATYAMRMAYGRSAEAIPSRSDSAYEDKLFKYYDEEYRKNLKVKNKTKSRKRFNDGYKSKFKKGGYRAKHIL